MKTNLKHTFVDFGICETAALSFQSDFSSRLFTTRLLLRLEP